MVVLMKQPDRSLVAALDPFMTMHGFKYVASRSGYYRKYDGGFDYFSWGSYPIARGEKWEAGYYEGHYGIGLRNDAIDALSSLVMPLHGGAGNQRYAITVYRSVGNPYGKWFAFDPNRDDGLCLRFDHLEEDVAQTASRIEAMLVADGLDWYSRYTEPTTLSRDINHPVGGQSPHPLINNPNLRPLVGIAAACVGDPKQVPELIREWLRYLQNLDQQFAQQRLPEVTYFARKFDVVTTKARELGYPV
jgi:hypothetical protein